MLCYEKRNLFNIEYINFKLKYFGMLLNKMLFKSIFFFLQNKASSSCCCFLLCEYFLVVFQSRDYNSWDEYNIPFGLACVGKATRHLFTMIQKCGECLTQKIKVKLLKAAFIFAFSDPVYVKGDVIGTFNAIDALFSTKMF